ncbi:hypothetical protein COLO4_15029 [Corchorus olitorius]|uniref:Uncharacterized protein n=1 Tax=Corchorus olitorius TaxID=93759 RepID=A0A1R3JPU7_9ROSI|nr:hypothetical protein COLO4_15029 [Corchorus olitorius]
MLRCGDTNMEIYLRKEIRSKCLKCQSKKRSGKVQGWAYESSDGQFSYHVACMKEAWLQNWKKGYFQLNDGENKRSLVLQNLAPKEVALRGKGQSSKSMKGVKWLIMFLKLVVSAIFGDPVSLIVNLFQISQM